MLLVYKGLFCRKLRKSRDKNLEGGIKLTRKMSELSDFKLPIDDPHHVCTITRDVLLGECQKNGKKRRCL